MSKTLACAVVTATALISRRMMRHACGGRKYGAALAVAMWGASGAKGSTRRK